MADVKPKAFEYQFGGRCLTSGTPSTDPTIEAILDMIGGSRALYAPQGRLTLRFENPPDGGSSGA